MQSQRTAYGGASVTKRFKGRLYHLRGVFGCCGKQALSGQRHQQRRSAGSVSCDEQPAAGQLSCSICQAQAADCDAFAAEHCCCPLQNDLRLCLHAVQTARSWMSLFMSGHSTISACIQGTTPLWDCLESARLELCHGGDAAEVGLIYRLQRLLNRSNSLRRSCCVMLEVQTGSFQNEQNLCFFRQTGIQLQAGFCHSLPRFAHRPARHRLAPAAAASHARPALLRTAAAGPSPAGRARTAAQRVARRQGPAAGR